MRAFLALDLSPAVKGRLGELIRSLSRGRRGIKWSDPEQIHVTLKFFGNLPESGLPGLKAVVERASGTFRPLRISVRGTGSFGPGGRIRVVWAGVEEVTGALAGLQAAIEEGLVPLGFPKEDRPFHPHLTLGRLRDPAKDEALAASLAGLAEFDGGAFLADRVVLYSSVLTPSGPVYGVVQTWPLEALP